MWHRRFVDMPTFMQMNLHPVLSYPIQPRELTLPLLLEEGAGQAHSSGTSSFNLTELS